MSFLPSMTNIKMKMPTLSEVYNASKSALTAVQTAVGATTTAVSTGMHSAVGATTSAVSTGFVNACMTAEQFGEFVRKRVAEPDELRELRELLRHHDLEE